jgi:hypothetical protein
MINKALKRNQKIMVFFKKIFTESISQQDLSAIKLLFLEYKKNENILLFLFFRVMKRL